MVLIMLSFSGCATTNAVLLSDEVKTNYVVTSGDIDRPYKSLGFVQITKKGLTIFGFVDLKGADLEGMFQDTLVTEIKEHGADGIINLHFHEIQYNNLTRSVFAVLFMFPLPNRVEVTGELVKFEAE